MKSLFLIPARAGSKGIIKKNTRVIGSKPLVLHALDQARSYASDIDICISTDDAEVIKVASAEGYLTPFNRPEHLASDNSGMRDVILHAIDYYSSLGRNYENVVLLQPTSPFRQTELIGKALELFDSSIDMVASVMESKANPYFVLFEEDENGLLVKSKKGHFASRQECPRVWQLNGAIYVINTESIKKDNISAFSKVRKLVMDQLHSLDLDTEIDWKLAQILNEEFNLLP
jgi:CMP-N,N'-diacetyllegionaminic acid synthase